MNVELLPKIRGNYRKNVKLKNWFDVGGPAEVLFRPADLEDLQFFLRNSPKILPINVLGAGSNVIIDDLGVAGIVIRMGSEFAEIFHQSKNDGSFEIRAGSAVPCSNLAIYCQNHGIAGLEFFATIPGSIGGAIAMNAGCYGSETADILKEVLAIDFQGNVQTLSKASCGFGYRRNEFAGKFIFLSGIFYGFPDSSKKIAVKIEDFKKNRELSQPIRAKTGGSTFKNPSEAEIAEVKRIDPENKLQRAWEFIDAVGFRGKILGGAKFSEKHCNFLINTGNASASDLLELSGEVRQKVFEQFNLRLELEIKHLR
jgi:UDP-N-acetylmuramate dehydrogenase